MTKIYGYLIGALVLVLLVGGVIWYVHDLHGAVELAQAKQLTAEQSFGACASALVKANDATSEAIAQAKAQREQAQAVIDQAGTQKGRNTAAGALFATKITDSAKAPDCQSVLEAQLCPALSGY